jgi:hypothetical protein
MINELIVRTSKQSSSVVGWPVPGTVRGKTTSMKLNNKILIVALSIAASTAVLSAQEGNPPRHQGGPEGGPRPPSPLLAALDANHDGVIDAAEIDNAAAALRKLDKNGDGKLTREELHPVPREGGPGRGEGREPRRGPGPGPGPRPQRGGAPADAPGH